MPKDRVDLICNVAELAAMFSGGHSLDDFLQNVADTVARHMQTSVCSIFLYDEQSRELVLSATKGLNRSCVGKVRLRLGEGLTGLSLKELRPIRESHGSKNPNFKYLPGTSEERYEAFLAVPIILGVSRVGVLVVQHVTPGYFDDSDTKALRAIASQLAGAIENAKLLISLRHGGTPMPARAQGRRPAGERVAFIKGISGSNGFAVGKATFFGEFSDRELDRQLAAAAPLSMADFEQSLVATERQLESLQSRMNNEMADLSAALIFNAHLLMLKDDMFSGAIKTAIAAGTAPPQAVADVVGKFVALFANSPNPRLREKVQDVRDLGHRLLLNLVPDGEGHQIDLKGRIVIAGELLPSDILKIVAQNASGLILTEGSFTAHAAILTRSLGMPLVIVSESQIGTCEDGETILVDADQGTVYINPDAEVVTRYRELHKARRAAEIASRKSNGPAVTLDGCPIRLLANINLLSELKVARQFKAEGVGLYRSEFPYIVRSNFPSEEEQYRIYRTVLDEMPGQDVVFRTLDVGGDKMLSYFATLPEANPFLGMRAIRLSLTRRDIFEPQLRALLRAGTKRDFGIMFPMISSVDEFLAAKAVTLHCIHELQEDGIELNPAPRLGAMIEIPAAVEVIDELAAASDFLCLGTNDLVQYMLAVDRTNEQVSDFYVPYHPAVLRALHRVAVAALAANKPLSLCGEMAGSRKMLPFLLGIGLTTFSLDARRIPVLREKIRTLSLANAKQVAARMLAAGTIKQVEAIIKEG